MDGLLTHVATTIGSSQLENVCTAALEWLARSRPAAGDALRALLARSSGMPLPPLVFDAQQGGGGIADLVGTDTAGVERVIVEAKVGDDLQPGQVGRYLRRLNDSAGPVIVLAPRERLPYVLVHARRQAADVDGTDLSDRVSGVTWDEVLRHLQVALEGDNQATWELDQVRGLFRDVDARSRLPLQARDMGRRAARAWWSTYLTVDELLTAATGIAGLSLRNRQGSKDGYGAYGRLHGHDVWVGAWVHPWGDTAETPFWLQVRTPPRPQQLAAALGGLYEDERVAVRVRKGDVVVPLYSDADVDPSVADAQLLGALSRAASLLPPAG